MADGSEQANETRRWYRTIARHGFTNIIGWILGIALVGASIGSATAAFIHPTDFTINATAICWALWALLPPFFFSGAMGGLRGKRDRTGDRQI
jgi:hypothetical protein